jgi:hypothetical protein
MRFIDRHPLHPDDPGVQRWLSQIVPGVAVLQLCPGGGERYGHLSIAAVPEDAVTGPAHALLAAWKASTCADEGWPYAPWDLQADRYALSTYRQQHAAWLTDHTKGDQDFLSWLVPLSRETVQAQLTLDRPLNAPLTLPDAAAVQRLGLWSLDFLAAAALRAILRDRWNDSQGLFLHDGRWLLVEWGTSA